MVNLQQVQAINQTNGVNMPQMQQSSQVFAEPGISNQIGGQQGYEPSEAGAPVDQVVKQQVQSQQQIEKQQQQQQQVRQRKQQQQQQQTQQQDQQQAQLQNLKRQEQNLKRQEQQLKEQIQRSQQQAHQQVQSGESEKTSMFSKYFVQTCFIIALVAGVVLYFLNEKGYLGKSSIQSVPPRGPRVEVRPSAPTSTGGNLNNMFRYLFNN
jgi:hypothetical protein